MVEIQNNYTGYKLVYDNDKNLPDMYEDPTNNVFDLLENEYLAVISTETGLPVDRLKWQDGKMKTI